MKAVWRSVVTAVLATFAVSAQGPGSADHDKAAVRRAAYGYLHPAGHAGQRRLVSRPGRLLASAPDLRANSLGMRFAQIPAGRFEMGSTIGPGEQPVHPVTVAGFWMGTTEVTQAQWRAAMGSNPSHFQQAGPDAPVEMVSWSDVQAFIARLNAREPDRRYRLPSEAEWEVRVPGRQQSGPVRPRRGDRLGEGEFRRHHAPGRPEAAERVRPLRHVRQRGGMVRGHVFSSHEGAPTDGSPRKGDPAAYHTLRGGGWDLPAFFIHAALRGPYGPIHRLGFRLVCVPLRP